MNRSQFCDTSLIAGLDDAPRRRLLSSVEQKDIIIVYILIYIDTIETHCGPETSTVDGQNTPKPCCAEKQLLCEFTPTDHCMRREVGNSGDGRSVCSKRRLTTRFTGATLPIVTSGGTWARQKKSIQNERKVPCVKSSSKEEEIMGCDVLFANTGGLHHPTQAPGPCVKAPSEQTWSGRDVIVPEEEGLNRVWNVLQKMKLDGGKMMGDALLRELQGALQRVSLAELGFDNRGSSGHADDDSRKITYLHIYEDRDVSMGIFCLPARSRIPLHDHPGMSVVSRVLYGDLHVSSFDWEESDSTTDQLKKRKRSEKLAKRVCDSVLRAHDAPLVLKPRSGGNIHQFTALTDSAVLDVLSPPYSTDESRDCTYYRVVKNVEDGRAVLEEYEPPLEFSIRTCVSACCICMCCMPVCPPTHLTNYFYLRHYCHAESKQYCGNPLEPGSGRSPSDDSSTSDFTDGS